MDPAHPALGFMHPTTTRCTLYVTLEPCQMCAGALMQSRIDRVVIGSMNPKAGCAGSVLNLLEMDGFNHKVEVIRGVLQEECSIMLSDFFRELREKKKMLKKSLAEQVGNQKISGMIKNKAKNTSSRLKCHRMKEL